VDDGDDSYKDDSDKDKADIEGMDADEDIDKDIDKDGDKGKSEVIYKLLTLNPLSNIYPTSSSF
jgi:hypothetical protein